MKRILSFVLALFLLSALLLTASSCAEKIEPSSKTPTASVSPTPSGEASATEPTEPTAAPLPDVSEIRGEVKKPVINERFDGETIRFFVSGGEGSMNARSIYIGENDDQNDPVNAAVKKRNEKVEEELGVKIELTEVKGMQDAYGYLAPILASRIYRFDVLALYQYFDLGLSFGDTVGSFCNYNRMPEGSYLDLDAKYWQRACLDALQIQTVSFFLTGDLNLNTLSAMEVSFVNAAMWKKYEDQIASLQNNPEGYTSVYDIVNNGYWTLDLFCELSKMPYKDLNENGAADYGDELGLIVYEEGLNCLMVDMFAAGAGVTYSTVTERNVEVIVNDKHNDYKPTPTSYYGKAPEISINTEHNKEIYTKLYTLLCQSSAANVPWMTKDNGEDFYIMEAFAEGNILLSVDALSCAEQYLSGMKDGYYIMPLPLYDRNQFDPSLPSFGYLTQCEDSLSQYAISAAVDPKKIPAITATMELMGYYSLTMTTPAYLDKALKGGYTDRTENAVILDRIREGVYFDYADLWGYSLDNPKWFARENYTRFGDKLERILKQQQDQKTRKLKKFLGQFWECFGEET